MKLIFFDVSVSLGLEGTGHVVDHDVMAGIALRREHGVPAAEVQDLFKGVLEAILGKGFFREAMMDAKHVAKIVQEFLGNNVGSRIAFDFDERASELRNDVFDKLELRLREVTQRRAELIYACNGFFFGHGGHCSG